MYNSTVEECLNQIAENAAAVRSALCDPNLEGFAIAGLQRLLSDNLETLEQLRKALPLALLVEDLPANQTQ
jgi:hypothetical protein